jgi:glycosyltransferase involved in cell wall biosynthesis
VGTLRWDVDFSSALENRTGKYFIGRDLLRDQADLIDRVRYWRAPAWRTPARAEPLLKLGMKLELRLASALGRRILPESRRPGRTLHLDPFSVQHSRLGREDMVLVHDMGPLSHPDLFQPWLRSLYGMAFDRIARAECGLVFVSQASRAAYQARYGDSAGASVIYPAIRAGIRSEKAVPVEGLEGPFLLTVGSLGRRKNQCTMIKAFARSGLARDGVRYVLCGALEPGSAEVERAAADTPGVLLLPYVSDAQLGWLYAQAAGFVLVSRLEGFGMPVAEAISHDLVPLVTRDSVLEEVAGAGALVADAEDASEIAAGMMRLIVMEEGERARRQELLRHALGRFSPAAFRTGWRAALTQGNSFGYQPD